MEQAKLDALIIAEPEGFEYATGAWPGVPALFRRAGAAFAVIPADPARDACAVIGDLYAAAIAAESPIRQVRTHPLWIETANVPRELAVPIDQAIRLAWSQEGRGETFRRPDPFDISLSIAALRDLLSANCLAAGRLGFDLDFISANDLTKLKAALPAATIVDGSPILDMLRAVKQPEEIEKLRRGVELAEAGMRNLMRETRQGQSVDDLRQHFRRGVAAEAGKRGLTGTVPSWEYISIGPDPWRPGDRVAPGSIIKVDVGCVIDGYSSDSSRNFVFGPPTTDQSRLHACIETAFAAGLAAFVPGRPIADIHCAATAALHDAGLTGYSRGHFGHGLGHAVFSEQWPFIAADTDIALEPGMVLAYEIPLYVTGFGGFNLEDQILVTADGYESMNTLPRHLIELGA
jgi:Xaa-Pro aminopeptidase